MCDSACWVPRRTFCSCMRDSSSMDLVQDFYIPKCITKRICCRSFDSTEYLADCLKRSHVCFPETSLGSKRFLTGGRKEALQNNTNLIYSTITLALESHRPKVNEARVLISRIFRSNLQAASFATDLAFSSSSACQQWTTTYPRSAKMLGSGWQPA